MPVVRPWAGCVARCALRKHRSRPSNVCSCVRPVLHLLSDGAVWHFSGSCCSYGWPTLHSLQ